MFIWRKTIKRIIKLEMVMLENSNFINDCVEKVQGTFFDDSQIYVEINVD